MSQSDRPGALESAARWAAVAGITSVGLPVAAIIVRQWPTQAKRVMNRVAKRMRERKEAFAMSML